MPPEIILHNEDDEDADCKSFFGYLTTRLGSPAQTGPQRSLLVRQFERKEKVRPYPSDLERFPNGRPQLKQLSTGRFISTYLEVGPSGRPSYRKERDASGTVEVPMKPNA